MSIGDDEMSVLGCWQCGQTGMDWDDKKCVRCSGTGKVFWVGGYAFPYTPEGEQHAKQVERKNG